MSVHGSATLEAYRNLMWLGLTLMCDVFFFAGCLFRHQRMGAGCTRDAHVARQGLALQESSRPGGGFRC